MRICVISHTSRMLHTIHVKCTLIRKIYTTVGDVESEWKRAEQQLYTAYIELESGSQYNNNSENTAPSLKAEKYTTTNWCSLSLFPTHMTLPSFHSHDHAANRIYILKNWTSCIRCSAHNKKMIQCVLVDACVVIYTKHIKSPNEICYFIHSELMVLNFLFIFCCCIRTLLQFSLYRIRFNIYLL